MISAWELIKAKVARWTPGGPSVSDGIGTKRYMPYILAQVGISVGLPPNGTIATNGTLTLGTALPVTYSGGIWLRFPANAVVGDSTGGIYWCVMSSTTVGTVYAGKIDTASAFTPYIGSTTGGAVTGSNSAYTQTTGADITLVNIPLPGGALGANGLLTVPEIFVVNNNSASSKWLKIKVDTEQIMSGVAGNALTTTVSGRGIAFFRNCGNEAKNIYNPYLTFSRTDGVVWSSVDTSVDKQLTIIGQLATVATDFLIISGFTIKVLPS